VADSLTMNLRVKLVTIVPLVAIVILIYKFANPPWTVLRVAGLAIAIAGFALLTLARVQLGNSFSIKPQARQLVTRGVYSRVRHPVYVFSAIGIAGLLLYLNFPWFLLFLLVLVPIQVLRARAEERVLEENFGDAYRQYKATTWF
jgi:protein-S-isoprenylcysteine O-methyltransferase Ste14